MVSRPKTVYVRSESYKRYVSGFPCFCCRIDGYTQVAHPNQSKYGKGRGLKSGDQYVFPLCGPRPGHMGCHSMHDLSIDTTREEANEAEDRWVSEMAAQAESDGWRIEGTRMVRQKVAVG